MLVWHLLIFAIGSFCSPIERVDTNDIGPESSSQTTHCYPGTPVHATWAVPEKIEPLQTYSAWLVFFSQEGTCEDRINADMFHRYFRLYYTRPPLSDKRLVHFSDTLKPPPPGMFSLKIQSMSDPSFTEKFVEPAARKAVQEMIESMSAQMGNQFDLYFNSLTAYRLRFTLPPSPRFWLHRSTSLVLKQHNTKRDTDLFRSPEMSVYQPLKFSSFFNVLARRFMFAMKKLPKDNFTVPNPVALAPKSTPKPVFSQRRKPQQDWLRYPPQNEDPSKIKPLENLSHQSIKDVALGALVWSASNCYQSVRNGASYICSRITGHRNEPVQDRLPRMESEVEDVEMSSDRDSGNSYFTDASASSLVDTSGERLAPFLKRKPSQHS